MILLLNLTACGVTKVNEDSIGKENSIEKNTELESDNTQEEEVAVETWGNEESTVREKDNQTAWAYIKFPELLGITEGSGEIAYQPDGSLVIFDGQYSNSPADSGVPADEIFPIYFEQTTKIMKAYKGFGYENFKFEVVEKENTIINDYEMCKYIGKHTFEGDGKTYEMSFVAYATRLKGNDAAVYWMVLDETGDQSLGELIESHADKMAKTLHE